MKIRSFCAAAAFAASLSIESAQAQTDKVATQKTEVSTKQGDWELGLFTGAVIPPGGGAKIGGGANLAYVIDKWGVILPYGEFSVLPGALNSSVTAGNETFKTTGGLLDFHFGAHIRIPLKKSNIKPYFVIAAGGFKPYSVSTDDIVGGKVFGTLPGSESVEFAFNYGGGIRWYVTPLIGFRVEAKAYGPESKFGGTPVRVMGGIFFQFKKQTH